MDWIHIVRRIFDMKVVELLYILAVRKQWHDEKLQILNL